MLQPPEQHLLLGIGERLRTPRGAIVTVTCVHQEPLGTRSVQLRYEASGRCRWVWEQDAEKYERIDK